MTHALAILAQRSHGKLFSGVVQIDVALIGEHPDAALRRQSNHRLQILRRHDCARRVRRRIQNDHFRARSHQALDHLRRHPEALAFVGLQEHAISARIANDVFERHPVRHRQNDFIAMVDQHLDGIEQRVLAPNRRHGFLAAVARLEIRRMAEHDGVAQFGCSAHRRVLREIILDGGDGGILDVLRRGKMRFARAEIHDINALLAQLVGFGYHRHGGRGLDAVNSFRESEGRNCFRNWSHARFPVLVLLASFSLIRGIKLFSEPLFHHFRHQVLDRSAEFCHLAHQPGTQVGVLFGRHHENCFQVGLQLAVHHRHLQLVFIVAERADAAQHGAGLDPCRVVHRQAVEDVHLNVLELGGQGLQHGAAFAQAEQRALLRIAQDGHDQLVENLAAPFNQVQVPVGRRIKRAGIDGDDLIQRSPQFPDGSRKFP